MCMRLVILMEIIILKNRPPPNKWLTIPYEYPFYSKGLFRNPNEPLLFPVGRPHKELSHNSLLNGVVEWQKMAYIEEKHKPF